MRYKRYNKQKKNINKKASAAEILIEKNEEK